MPILRTVQIAGVLGVTLLLQAQPGLVSPRFVDVAESGGVSFEHRSGRTSQKYLIETMGSGVALLDYDDDGLLDIYLLNGAALDAPMPAGAEPDKTDPAYWNRLYRNLGNWRFEDVTEAAGAAGRGYGMGAAVGDYDNDGDPDLYVTNFGRNILLENDGAGSFTDVTTEAGVGGRGWSSGAAFVDYDRDGRLDLFVARYLDWDFSRNIPCGNGLPDRRSYCHPRRFAPIEHLLFRNTGQGSLRMSLAPPVSVLTPARASAWLSATTTATVGSTSSLQTMHIRNSSSATSTASASRRSAWLPGLPMTPTAATSREWVSPLPTMTTTDSLTSSSMPLHDRATGCFATVAENSEAQRDQAGWVH